MDVEYQVTSRDKRRPNKVKKDSGDNDTVER
ncbi:protein of unknown function [Thermococcus nautili]|nr:protein of unknown function [Thermococcus nautili]